MTKKSIVCLGDSITWGWPHGVQYSWVRMLSEAVDTEFVNQGVPGYTTSDMLSGFNRQVLKYRPAAVVIMGGANDVLQGESRARITYNIEQMVETAENNSIQVIFGLCPPLDYPPMERLLAALRAWMREYARAKDIPVIDFTPAFYDEAGCLRGDTLLPDGAHPTVKGYEEMFKQIDLEIFREIAGTGPLRDLSPP